MCIKCVGFVFIHKNVKFFQIIQTPRPNANISVIILICVKKIPTERNFSFH